MSLVLNSRYFENELRLRFTSVDPDEPIFNTHFCWVPKKDELEDWKRLLAAATSSARTRYETPHKNYDPFVEIDIESNKVTVTAFSYEFADNFYEDDFSEEITPEEFSLIAIQIITELEKLQ